MINKIVIFLHIFITHFAFSQEEKIDINGVWTDKNETIKKAVAIFSEQDGKVLFSHYLEWKGQKFVESGFGTRIGNSITYTVDVTLKIEGWATKGIHVLTLSKDGNTLSGHFKDNKNKEGPILFKRVL